ncbi:hypothetical protein, partial [Streptomyces sp. SBT349]|uniref:hypothetical protein n=1 Tax=Streptomyces sp. SBT349 TaxID=1580539 RepID=UPI00066B5B2A
LTPQQLAVLAALIQQQTPTPHAPPNTPPRPAHTDTHVSGRAKSTALVAGAGGVGVGAATAGIGYGSELVAASSGGLMDAAQALAIIAGSIVGAAWFLTAALRRRPNPSPSETEQPTTHITQNITASGMFGKANGTINHR